MRDRIIEAKTSQIKSRLFWLEDKNLATKDELDLLRHSMIGISLPDLLKLHATVEDLWGCVIATNYWDRQAAEEADREASK